MIAFLEVAGQPPGPALPRAVLALATPSRHASTAPRQLPLPSPPSPPPALYGVKDWPLGEAAPPLCGT